MGLPRNQFSWVAIRRCAGIASIAVALYAFVRMEQVGDWIAVPLRLPYSGKTLKNVPLSITKDGIYLAQLEISRKTHGESIDPPTVPPIRVEVLRNGHDECFERQSELSQEEWKRFGFTGFSAKKGEHFLINVWPEPSLSNYKGYVKHVVVERDIRDYSLFMFQQLAWFVLLGIFLVTAAVLLSQELKTFARRLGLMREVGAWPGNG